MGRAPCCEKMGLKKGPWTPEEDHILVHYIRLHGHSNWRALPKHAGLLRCGKSCRLRWTNYLRPDIKRGNFTQEEEDTIINLHQMLGNRWSAIAAKLPGRTDNEIKNVWHTHLKKRLPVPSLNKNNPDNSDPTTAAPDTAAVGPARKRSRKVNVVPKKKVSMTTHEKSMEPNGIINEVTTCTNSIKIEPISPQPCTSDVSTVTSTSTVTNSGDNVNLVKIESNEVDNKGGNKNEECLGDLLDINDDFWMKVLSIEDTAISIEDDRVLGDEPMFETAFPSINSEDMDCFWRNLLTESHELPGISDML